jgi:hypothetical protein
LPIDVILLKQITMKKLTIFSFLISFTAISVLAQPCSVNVDSLKGQYSGGCSNGKADGKGTANGIDTYSGEFRNGYPDGQGKYIWKNGNWYEGSWKKGQFNGEGSLHTKKNDVDSAVVITGFWTKGKYVGKYEKPYSITALTNAVNTMNIRKQKNGQSEINISVKNTTGGAFTVKDFVAPKSKLVDIELLEGRFEQQVNDEQTTVVPNKYILRRVTFPFRANLVFETVGALMPHKEKVAVEIMESGNWYIQVDIDN